MASSNGAQASQLFKEESSGNLSDVLEGLNLAHASNDSMSVSPLSQGRSPVQLTSNHDELLDGRTSFGMEPTDELAGLEHPLAAAAAATTNGSNRPAPLSNRLPPRPRPPPLSNKNDRTVSWGMAGPPPMMTVDRKEDADGEDFSHLSNTDSKLNSSPQSKRNITMNDLANGFETEAETYIQRTLDEIDPTKAGPSDAQQSILGFVPADADPETFDDTAVPKQQQQQQQLPKPILRRAVTSASRTHGRTRSTAEDLFQLTNDLTVLNKHHGKSIRNFGDSFKMDNADASLTDQDMLMKNAATLMKRNNVGPKDSSDTSSNADAEQEHDGLPKAKTANDRWNALKHTVQSTSPTKKKTDEHDTDGTPIEHDLGSNKKDDDSLSNHDDETFRTSSGPGRSHPLRATRRQKLKSRYKDFEDWLKIKKMSLYAYVKFMLFFLILPAIGVAAILYYLVGNPPCGTSDECNDSLRTELNVTSSNTTFGGEGADLVAITKQIFEEASASWWVLFVCCRQPITLSLALATQAFIIEFLALRTKWAVKLIGPFFTLFVVQSKGWPFILFWWFVYNFVMLYGPTRWARHWLYWQPYVGLFNEQNPSGSFTSTGEYRTVLIVALVVSAIVAVKRFWVGFWFGKKTYHRYAEDLTAVMKKSLLIGQVASLARDREELGLQLDNLGLDMRHYEMEDELREDGSKASISSREVVKSPGLGVVLQSVASGGGSLMQKANLSSIQKIRINELLGAWEEPEVSSGKEGKAPIAAIIQFRQSLSYLNTAFPFSVAFGPAPTRKECVSSTEAVYHRLIGDDRVLNFDVIASLAVRRNGDLDEDKLKALIKLFRPERDGTLNLVDFAKSVDAVYKELRLLRASVANSTKMDASFESIFNVIFYFILACIVLSILGIDPIVLFASISGFVIGFAFMIGSACAKYFEGVLFIIVRKPYDIGDRINVSNPMLDTPSAGSPGWVVKDVDLFTTTVLYASTNEVATYSNSSLAACRIINGARSPKAAVNFLIKFPLDISYKKLQVYKGAVEQFIKARPREWGAFVGFRASRVEVDFGFVEYIVLAEHRESWQHAPTVKKSQADLTSFCLELSKKMNMRYRSPPMPIDLCLAGGGSPPGSRPFESMINTQPYQSPSPATDRDERPAARDRANTMESVDWQTVSAMFETKK